MKFADDLPEFNSFHTQSDLWRDNVQAASMASVTTLAFSVTSGGILCILVVLLLTSWLVEFRKYDVESNEFAIAQRKIRAERENL
jgi:hypothetical protein